MRQSAARRYLLDLERLVQTGVRALPQGFVARQAAYVRSAQNGDGGFPGRDGASDPYYTSFALRTAHLCDGSTEPALWHRAGDYLTAANGSVAGIVDCFCLLYVAHLVGQYGWDGWDERERAEVVAAAGRTIGACHHSDGGYARAPGGPPSLYHTFLATLCCGLLDVPEPDGADVLRLVRAHGCAGGGFADLVEDVDTGGGVNPTAAAVGLLSMAGRLQEISVSGTAGLLLAMQREDGGFAPHADAPASDLLSTFTALLSLEALGAAGRARLADVGRFVKALSAPVGGFRGSRLDGTPDLEYTFYGLATLGLLALRVAGPQDD